MRQVVLDTETTGIGESHRIIEIGCLELIDRKLTGRKFHQYLNPQRLIDAEAMAVHGITNEFLEDKPLFSVVAQDFIDFIHGAQLVIHNAPFDVGFMDREFALVPGLPKTKDICSILDTLTLARSIHPGQRNSLDALCRRYGIDNSHREYHGALLDSEILAEVYLFMTGGQTNLVLDSKDEKEEAESRGISLAFEMQNLKGLKLPNWGVSEVERLTHDEYLTVLAKKSDKVFFNV